MLGLLIGLNARQNLPWWPDGAVFAADFAGDRYMRDGVNIPAAQAYRLVRASSKLAEDSNGVWHSFGPNVLARTDKGVLIEPAAENFVPNSSMGGAQPSSTNLLDGLPTGWEMNKVDGSSIKGQVLSAGPWLGLPSITLRLWGNSTVEDVEIRMMSWANHQDNMPVSQGQSVRQSVFVERVGGSADNVSGRFRLTERTATGEYVAKQSSPMILDTAERLEAVFSVGAATTKLALSSIEFGFAGSFDITIRLATPHMGGEQAGSPILTTTAPSSRDADRLTLLLPAESQLVHIKGALGWEESFPVSDAEFILSPAAVAGRNLYSALVYG